MRKTPRAGLRSVNPALEVLRESRSAKALAGFSRHPLAGFTDLNPAPRGLSIYNLIMNKESHAEEIDSQASTTASLMFGMNK